MITEHNNQHHRHRSYYYGDLTRRDIILTTTAAAAAVSGVTGGNFHSSPAMAATTTATNSQQQQDYVTLFVGQQEDTNDIKFPLVSFGLQIYDDATAYKLTMIVLEVGYRNFFSSVLARNQIGFAKAIRDSGINRNELFLCGSVVSNRVSGYENAKRLTTKGWIDNINAFSKSNIDYLDQIMLNYPGSDKHSILGQWSLFQDMYYNEKLVKTLSVSNFNSIQQDYVLNDKDTIIKLCVNQLPYSVAYHPKNVLDENNKRNILVQAWSPLGLGGSLGGRFTSEMKNNVLKLSGVAVCTQTKKKEHFIGDINLFDFQLTNEDIITLSNLAL